MQAEPAPAGGLRIRAVTVARDGRAVLKDVDADFPAGAVTAVAGPSGSGKSTLLRLCNGLLAPDEGAITLDGADTRSIDAPTLRRRVGLVAQRPVMLVGTVSDNVRYGAPDADVTTALHDSGLAPEFAARDASRLSGGEQARVAIARALVRDPRALLLDEATAPLDREVALHVGETMSALARDGIAVVLPTHDRWLADRVCDHQVELRVDP